MVALSYETTEIFVTSMPTLSNATLDVIGKNNGLKLHVEV